MKKIVRLTESDLVRLVKRVIKEQSDIKPEWDKVKNYLLTVGFDGAKGKEEADNSVRVKGKDFIYSFLDTGQVFIVKLDTSAAWQPSANNSWKWDGQKVTLEKPLPYISKSVTGFAQTEEEIESGRKILGLGSRGDLVKKVQYALSGYDYAKNIGCKPNATGFTDCDGIYGKNTKMAVDKFQRTNNLSADGNVGRQTSQSLHDSMNQ